MKHTTVAILLTLLLSACERSPTPQAPLYAVAMLDSTEVTWDIEKDRIGGGYTINHPGDPDHKYIVILSLACKDRKLFITCNSEPVPLDSVRRGSWHDIPDDKRKGFDWPTTRIWAEIRIYDANGRVIYHGIRQSDPFAPQTSKTPDGAERPGDPEGSLERWARSQYEAMRGRDGQLWSRFQAIRDGMTRSQVRELMEADPDIETVNTWTYKVFWSLPHAPDRAGWSLVVSFKNGKVTKTDATSRYEFGNSRTPPNPRARSDAASE